MSRLTANVVSLSGIWQFRPDSQETWQPLSVPGCWENLGLPHDWEGPGWYRRTVEIPEAWQQRADRRLWLRFGAVSYACRVWVNGREVGAHIGAWDAFTLEVTEAVGATETAEILVRVIKPGGPTYPTRQTTSGFLPYVWGYLFGGLWQEVTLECTGPDGLLETQELALQDGAKEGVAAIEVIGNTPFLHGLPFYPRMALSWGWYPETLHCNPPAETMRAELEKLRALGYNGVKCCLWVPPPAYLDLCDALGMWVWLELPLWLPEMDAEQQAQALREYEAIVRQVRHHPCIVLWTLGCELSASCGEAFLEHLYARVKTLTGSPLVRDNSGGGECYGGLLREYADYYDYHFYCDLPFLRNTFDYFLPRWRPAQPWFFGEFCDADAFRDLVALREAHGGELPWWAVDDPERNPQGVRWDMNITGQWAQMERHGLFARRAELKEGQRRQTLLHRKFTVELVRSYREMSGYVITGLRDTPISIAGMFDDFGHARYTPEEFTRFNADTVLFLGWHRRRNWVAGGDRPSYIDHWSHWAGETLLPRIGISHYGPHCDVIGARWELRSAEGATLTEGTLPGMEGVTLEAGTVAQLALIEVAAPVVTRMTRVEFCVTATLEARESRSRLEVKNEWPLWIVPHPEWNRLPSWFACDPDGRLAGLERHGATWQPFVPSVAAQQEEGEGACSAPDKEIVVASRWTPELEAFLRQGGRVFAFLDQSGGLPVGACPFWREAMKLFEPHPFWDRFPHEGFTDLQFYGLGPDGALDPEMLTARFPEATFHPLLRRVDARTFAVTDYLTEAHFPGGGRLLLTTLRPQGGLGDQPDGLLRHVAGVQFLFAALCCLAEIPH